MTQFSDGVRVGAVGAYGRSIDPGVPLSPMFFHSSTPNTASISGLGDIQVLSGSAAAATLTAGVGVTTTSINGITYLDMGVDRAITVSGASASAAAVVVTAQGMTNRRENTTLTVSSSAGSGKYTSLQTARFIRSAAVNGNTVSGIALGTSDVLGLPFRVDNAGDLFSSFNGDKITTSAGFVAAVTTTPATAATGDTRGTQLLPIASNGVRKFTSLIYIRDPDTTDGTYGVTKFYNGP